VIFLTIHVGQLDGHLRYRRTSDSGKIKCVATKSVAFMFRVRVIDVYRLKQLDLYCITGCLLEGQIANETYAIVDGEENQQFFIETVAFVENHRFQASELSELIIRKPSFDPFSLVGKVLRDYP